MNDESQANLFLAALEDKYRKALRDEQAAINDLNDARRRKEIYGLTLKEEGAAIPTLEESASFTRAGRGTIIGAGALGSLPFKSPTNGHKVTPLSGNHALHILMTMHGNKGFSFGELRRYSEEEGFPMSEEEVKKTFWRLQSKRLAERMDDGRVRLTEEGLKFDRFRVAKMS